MSQERDSELAWLPLSVSPGQGDDVGCKSQVPSSLTDPPVGKWRSPQNRERTAFRKERNGGTRSAQRNAEKESFLLGSGAAASWQDF